MLEHISWTPSEGRKINCRNFNELKEPRIGVMIHFDDSGDDQGAMAWFESKQCKVSYNYLVLDNGSYVIIAPDDKRAWHAGVCSPSSGQLPYHDANSAFVGIAAATNTSVRATPEQHFTIAWLARRLFGKYRWDLTESWRITGHDAEAVYPRLLESGKPNPKAGQRGRKIDPTGFDREDPIVSMTRIREYITRIG